MIFSILAVILLFNIRDHPISESDKSYLLKDYEIIYSAENSGMTTYLLRNHYRADPEFYVFSQSAFLPRHRLVFTGSLTSFEDVINVSGIPGQWHNFDIKIKPPMQMPSISIYPTSIKLPDLHFMLVIFTALAVWSIQIFKLAKRAKKQNCTT